MAEGSEHVVAAVGNAIVAKHPLQNSWQMWYYQNKKDCDWEQNLLKVTKVNTIEDFWA